MTRHRIRYNARAGRECERLDRIAETITIPVLQPITTRPRQLDPAVWGRSFDGDEA